MGRNVALILVFLGIGLLTAVAFFFIKPGRKPPRDIDPGGPPQA